MVTIHPAFFQDKPVIVMGLGLSGLATAQALHESGVKVIAWDDSSDQRQLALDKGIAIKDPIELNGTKPYSLILSPGIPHHLPKPHPIALHAQQHAWPIICDVELFLQMQPKARVIGITGTNGKSTTTALIAHILRQILGKDKVLEGGNIGKPILTLPDLPEDGFYVVELSSYQLERMTTKGLDGGVLLNITPDHLARHGTIDGYKAIKSRLFNLLKSGGWGVIGLDDQPCTQIYQTCSQAGLKDRLITLTTQNKSGQFFIDHGQLYDQSHPIMNLAQDYPLPGAHNWQNAAASYAILQAMGFAPDQIINGLKSFSGLEHRQEPVLVHKQVTFINDSKATNIDAATKALGSYPRIYWIAGGQPKEPDFTGLLPHLSAVVQAFLIGDAVPDLARDLQGHVPYEICGTMDKAVAAATQAALKDPQPSVVLLSPACASFDQFKNFEDRGQVFKKLVLDGLPS